MSTDKSLGAVMVLLGGGGIALASQITVRTFNNDPGPKLFPIFACTILVICGLGMLLTQSRSEARSPITSPEFWRGTTMALLLGGYAIALWLVGFHLATLAAAASIYWTMAGNSRRFWKAALFAIMVTAAVHLLFAVGLGAFLPRGILFAGF